MNRFSLVCPVTIQFALLEIGIATLVTGKYDEGENTERQSKNASADAIDACYGVAEDLAFSVRYQTSVHDVDDPPGFNKDEDQCTDTGHEEADNRREVGVGVQLKEFA